MLRFLQKSWKEKRTRNKESTMAKELKRGVGDVMKWVMYVQRLANELNSDGKLENGALLLKHSEEFSKMAADVAEAIKDGFDFSDLSLLAKLVPEIMEIAAKIEGASGEDKKSFVIDAVWLIYHSVDTGPDGKYNRLKIPFLGWLSFLGISAAEEKVERFILKVATEFAIEAAYSYLKEKGVV